MGVSHMNMWSQMLHDMGILNEMHYIYVLLGINLVMMGVSNITSHDGIHNTIIYKSKHTHMIINF